MTDASELFTPVNTQDRVGRLLTSYNLNGANEDRKVGY